MPDKFNEYDPLDIELKQLFERNKEWAAQMVEDDPAYFSRLVTQQLPKYFWIGCSDSRVPSTQITNLLPGDIFGHRNVASVVSYTDCSGVHVAMMRQRVGLADNWLRHVQDVHQKHEKYLGDTLPPRVKYDRLCELNVIESVANVCQTTIVQDAWNRGQQLTVHGWVYGVHDGLIRDLGMTISSMDELHVKKAESLARYEIDPPKERE